MKQLKVISSLIIIVAMLMAAVPAQAYDPGYPVLMQTLSYGTCVLDGTPYEEVRAQMYVEVWDLGPLDADTSQVAFKFFNVVEPTPPGIRSSITQIYFDDGALLDIAQIEDSDGTGLDVDFYAPPPPPPPQPPPNLPGGNACGFEASRGFVAKADSPVYPSGVNHTVEWVSFIFNLQDGLTYADVATALTNGGLKIGIHVQGIGVNPGEDFSQSFVSNGPVAVTLSSFGGKVSKGNTTLAWATGTENDNAGFNLYRSTSAAGARTLLNSKLLAAKGDTVSGASYSFTDSSGYGTFYYWLEDVSTSGTATLHGPVLAVVTSPFRSPLYRPALPSR